MINRINLILRAKNITARQFAEEIGIQPSGMSHIMGGRNNPSLDFVSKVLRRYPEIDANWLLLGKGEMYASGASPAQPSALPSSPLPERQAEPSLFDEEPLPLPSVSEPVRESRYQDEVLQEEEHPYVPSYISTAPETREEEKGEESCVERILFIYSDNTYKVLRPRP